MGGKETEETVIAIDCNGRCNVRDYIDIGPSPSDEDCAQVGSDDYPERSKLECRLFHRLLWKTFGDPPGDAMYGIKSFEHDFGTYREVVVYFNPEDEREVNFAFKVQDNCPAKWPEDYRVALSPEGNRPFTVASVLRSKILSGG